MRKYLPKRLLFLLPGIAAVIITLYARYHPAWTEAVYSQGLYPALSAAAGFLPSLVRFSFTEWLVLLFALFCLRYIILSIRKVVKAKEGRGMAAYRAAAGAAAIFSMLYFVFTASCGLNYHRYTFTHYTGYDVEPSTVAELEQLCLSLAGDLERAREQLGEGREIHTAGPGDFDAYAARSVEAVRRLSQQYPMLERQSYSEPKPMVLSGLMSYLGIGGVFFPFTLESNINAEIPYFMLPSTMAHELAHQCGFMREDEANFIAYLACMESEDDLMCYSGLFLAFDRSVAVLEELQPERALEIVSGLNRAVGADVAFYNDFWESHEGFLTDFSSAVIDGYLKANNQADGVTSYDRMVDLLLAEQRAAA